MAPPLSLSANITPTEHGGPAHRFSKMMIRHCRTRDIYHNMVYSLLTPFHHRHRRNRKGAGSASWLLVLGEARHIFGARRPAVSFEAYLSSAPYLSSGPLARSFPAKTPPRVILRPPHPGHMPHLQLQLDTILHTAHHHHGQATSTFRT